MIGDILQPTHLLFILAVALLVLGPSGCPRWAARSAGDSASSRGAMSGLQEQANLTISPPAAPKRLSMVTPQLKPPVAMAPDAPPQPEHAQAATGRGSGPRSDSVRGREHVRARAFGGRRPGQHVATSRRRSITQTDGTGQQAVGSCRTERPFDPVRSWSGIVRQIGPSLIALLRSRAAATPRGGFGTAGVQAILEDRLGLFAAQARVGSSRGAQRVVGAQRDRASRCWTTPAYPAQLERLRLLRAAAVRSQAGCRVRTETASRSSGPVIRQRTGVASARRRWPGASSRRARPLCRGSLRESTPPPIRPR